MTEWEDAVLRALCGVEAPGLDLARASIDHLVVTGVCECGCGSFNVRDLRCEPEPHQLHHVANGACGDVGFALFLGPDGRPTSVDVFLPDERSIDAHGRPDPAAMVVTPVP